MARPAFSRAEKIARARIDAAVDAAVRRHCCNVPIDILKIGDVFRAAHAAAAAGADVERAAVVAYFQAAGRDLPAAFQVGA